MMSRLAYTGAVKNFKSLTTTRRFSRTLLGRVLYRDESPKCTLYELQAVDGTLIRMVGWPQTAQQNKLLASGKTTSDCIDGAYAVKLYSTTALAPVRWPSALHAGGLCPAWPVRMAG